MKCAIQPRASEPPMAPANMLAGFIGDMPIMGATHAATIVITMVPITPANTAFP
jgi:hypothetical protein